MTSPKIVVLRLKDILYSLLFATLGIILIIVLIMMFTGKDKKNEMPTMNYTPGIYTSSFKLDQQVVNVEVTIYENKVQGVKFQNLDPNLELRYQLLQPAMANINDQMKDNEIILDVEPTERNKDTTAMIMGAVEKAVAKAEMMNN